MITEPNVHFSSASNEWSTPQAFFDELDDEFNFTLDPCSTHENAKCAKHFTIEDDGLAQDWSHDIVFMNPPYGRAIKDWIRKAYESSLGGGNCSLFDTSTNRHILLARVLYAR